MIVATCPPTVNRRLSTGFAAAFAAAVIFASWTYYNASIGVPRDGVIVESPGVSVTQVVVTTTIGDDGT